jgi:hypothetical protein
VELLGVLDVNLWVNSGIRREVQFIFLVIVKGPMYYARSLLLPAVRMNAGSKYRVL